MNDKVKIIQGHQTNLFRTTDGQEWLSRKAADAHQDILDADPNAERVFTFTATMDIHARS